MLLKKCFKKRTVKKEMSLREFYDKRDKVLVVRNARGMGDILMHRMIFEDFHKIMPGIKITFACPKPYHDLIEGHPFVQEVVDSGTVERSEYLISYDTSSCCIKHECATAPFADKHRADIWAEHCGVTLTNHDMHLPIMNNEALQTGYLRIKMAKSQSTGNNSPNSPNVLFTPYAFDVQRTLPDRLIVETVKILRGMGCFVYSTYQHDVKLLDDLDVPVLCGYSNHEFFSFVHAADYVVTVDTSVFHYAGGIKKPLTGIFTHVDGKYRGRYFDFVLVQKHRDNGNWPCGPCYNFSMCTHPGLKGTDPNIPRPCVTQLTSGEIKEGISKMFTKWPWKK